MNDLILFPLLASLSFGLTPINWHGKLGTKARDGIRALQDKGYSLKFDKPLFDQTERVVGFAFTALAAGVSAGILALLLQFGEPDLLQRIGTMVIPAVGAAILYPRRVLVTYWGRQAHRDGVELPA